MHPYEYDYSMESVHYSRMQMADFRAKKEEWRYNEDPWRGKTASMTNSLWIMRSCNAAFAPEVRSPSRLRMIFKWGNRNLCTLSMTSLSGVDKVLSAAILEIPRHKTAVLWGESACRLMRSIHKRFKPLKVCMDRADRSRRETWETWLRRWGWQGVRWV